jgi:hypothetical protein
MKGSELNGSKHSLNLICSFIVNELCHHVQTNFGFCPSSCLLGTGGPFPRGKACTFSIWR